MKSNFSLYVECYIANVFESYTIHYIDIISNYSQNDPANILTGVSLRSQSIPMIKYV